MINLEEKHHAKLSPSASKRWMTCPGSIGMTEDLKPIEKPSRFAAEGTVAHEVHELCLKEFRDAKHYLGKAFEADGFKFKVTPNMVEAVQESLDYIRERIEVAESMGKDVKINVETKCSLKSLGIPGLDGGTSDVILETWNNCELEDIEVYDYKHGAGVAVEALGNTQAMCYALGVLLMPQYHDQSIPYGITITIGQPRAHHNCGRIRSWELTKNDLLDWCKLVLVPAAKATMEENAPLIVSEDGCRFCPVAGQCPKLFERTQEVAMVDFADSDDEVKLPDINTLTAEQKRFVMDNGNMLRAFIVAVENQIKHEVDHGSKAYEGHYKLVCKTTRRKFVEDALDELASPLLDHLDSKDIFEEKPRAITEIERRLKKAIGVKHSKEVMNEITIKPAGELVIAHQSDKRKSQQPSIIGDFNNIELYN